MGVLQRFERRLEGMVEGAFARAFKGNVEPVEIASALQREAADKKAIVGPGRTLVPNDYIVELGAADHQRLAPYAAAIQRELATMLTEHAAEQGWQFVGPVTTTMVLTDDLDTGVFRVRSGVLAPPELSGGLVKIPQRPAAGPRWRSVFPGAPRLVISTGGNVTEGTVEARVGSHAIELVQAVTVIGRGNDVDLRLLDPGVSRRHVQVRVTDEGVYAEDLGSTNGTTLDGVRLNRPTLLRPGGRLSAGATTLIYDRDPVA
ncbi:MAG: domain containing protein [Frankiales bacterium]|nr:domain containing protein [Frankiales bacterium]